MNKTETSSDNRLWHKSKAVTLLKVQYSSNARLDMIAFCFNAALCDEATGLSPRRGSRENGALSYMTPCPAMQYHNSLHVFSSLGAK